MSFPVPCIRHQRYQRSACNGSAASFAHQMADDPCRLHSTTNSSLLQQCDGIQPRLPKSTVNRLFPPLLCVVSWSFCSLFFLVSDPIPQLYHWESIFCMASPDIITQRVNTATSKTAIRQTRVSLWGAVRETAENSLLNIEY